MSSDDRRRHTVTVVLVALLLLACAIGYLATQRGREVAQKTEQVQQADQQVQVEEQRRKVAEELVADIYAPVYIQCSAHTKTARRLHRDGVCKAIKQAITRTNRASTPTAAPTKVPIDGLTAVQQIEVAQIAADAVAANPALSRAQTTDLIVDWYRRNPPPPGATGPSGPPGQSPTTAQVRAIVDAVYAANPPKNGVDGTSPPCLTQPGQCEGDDGKPGPMGPPGPGGPKGNAGVGIASAVIDDAGHLIVTLTDGTIQDAGVVVGAAGPSGPAGRGITALACDTTTEQFVVTYSDGSSAQVPGSDCVADPAPAPPTASATP